MLDPDEQLAQEVDRVEPLGESVPPTPAPAQAVAQPQRREREDAADGHGDRPGHRQPRSRLVHVVDEHHDRDDARCGGEERVLEGAEPQDPDARLAIADPFLAERMEVEREASAGDERAEAGCDEGDRPRRCQRRPAFDAGHLAVGEDVPHVGERLRAERGRQPDAVDSAQAVRDRTEAGGPRDADEGGGGKRGREGDEEDHLA